VCPSAFSASFSFCLRKDRLINFEFRQNVLLVALDDDDAQAENEKEGEKRALTNVVLALD